MTTSRDDKLILQHLKTVRHTAIGGCFVGVLAVVCLPAFGVVSNGGSACMLLLGLGWGMMIGAGMCMIRSSRDV